MDHLITQDSRPMTPKYFIDVFNCPSKFINYLTLTENFIYFKQRGTTKIFPLICYFAS